MTFNLKREPNPETIHKLEVVTSPKPTNLNLDVWVLRSDPDCTTKQESAHWLESFQLIQYRIPGITF